MGDAVLASGVAKNVFALIIIDVQYCFINGSLALSDGPAGHNAAEVIPIINELIAGDPFDVFAYSLDWHPAEHISFVENLPSRADYLLDPSQNNSQILDKVTYTGPKYRTEQVLWPAHCIEHTPEAELHADLTQLNASDNVIYIRKGVDPEIDSYSAFADNNWLRMTELHEQLQSQGVTHVFVAGLALDYCVGSTAIDAALLNYKAYVIEDASRGVDQQSIADRLRQFEDYGVKLIQSGDVRGIIEQENSVRAEEDMCPRSFYPHFEQ